MLSVSGGDLASLTLLVSTLQDRLSLSCAIPWMFVCVYTRAYNCQAGHLRRAATAVHTALPSWRFRP